MEKAHLAAMGILILMVMASQALQCLSSMDCCQEKELAEVGKKLTSHYSEPNRTSSQNCSATLEGPNNMRSTSPWRYVEDFNGTRYPQRLWKAQCICRSSCVSVRHPLRNGKKSNFVKMEGNGNSVPIEADTLVYYRVPCKGKHTSFYLKPEYYSLPVGCTCLAHHGD